MTKRRPAAACVGLAAFLQAGLVHAYTSPYSGMAVAGTFNGWNPAANLSLIADNTWQGSFYLPLAQRSEFKFAANGAWTDDWGETNQSDFSEPVSGVAEYKGSNIAISNTVGDLYVFTFNDSSRAYTVELRARSPYQTNLLRNASFETAGSTSERAQSWEYNNPDAHGSYWGSAARADWRHYPETQGAYEGVVRGTWAGMGDIGGWWQEGPADGGMTYEASAWFWADAAPPYGPWSATLQELKIEFFSPAYQQLGLSATNFQDVADGWTQKIVRGTAPAGTAWARFVVSVVGAGPAGALNVDHADLRALVSRSQSFSDWATPDADAAYTRGGWLIRTGRTTTVNARSGYAASLPNPTGSPFDGNHVQSPCFTNGVGTLSFWYRHGHTDTNSEPEEPIGFTILQSQDSVNWSAVTTVTNILALSYAQFSRYLDITGPIYLRIQHAGGTNSLLLDDMEAAAPSDVVRFQDFNSWPDSATNAGCHAFQDWLVCSGRVTGAFVESGAAALLPGSAGDPNVIRSPSLLDGYGTISFTYRKGTNGSLPAAFSLQSSPDGISWSPLVTLSNISAISFMPFSQYFYAPAPAYLRIANVSSTNLGGPGGMELINEGFDAAPTVPAGWVDGGTAKDSDPNHYASPPNCRAFGAGDNLQTPAVNKPTAIEFYVDSSSGGGGNAAQVEYNVNAGAWTPLGTFTALTAGATVNYPLTNAPNLSATTNVRFRFSSTFNTWYLDNVRITGTVDPVPQPPQDLLVDDINIGPAVLYRTQDFDAWPRKGSYAGGAEFQGWSVWDAIVDDEKPYAGQVARLNTTAGSYILSPFFPDGVGPVTFQYASWDTNPPITFLVQTSTNGVTWSNRATVVSADTNYTLFSTYLYETTGLYVRIYHHSGSERLLVDDINIRRPQPPANVDLGTYIQPGSPFTNDPVYVWASAFPRYDAQNIAVTTYYRIGTSGVFAALPMKLEDAINYRTTSAIPAQPSGTIVQYYVRCDFGGLGSYLTSPRYSPSGGSNDPAWYGVPRGRPGRIWINEVKYNDIWDLPEYGFVIPAFIELAGPAGADLARWMIQIVYQGYVSAAYSVTNNPVLLNEGSGFGFWVIGNTNVVERDQTLTNKLWQTPIGIRLLNEMGGLEAAYCVEGTMAGFERIPVNDYDSWPGTTGISLTGTGTNYASFYWISTNLTPGAANIGQTFGTNGVSGPPDTMILWMAGGTNVTISTRGNTNNWSVAPYYATGLAAPQQWTAVSPFSSSFAGGTNVIWFSRPAGTVTIYRVLFTQP